MIGVVVVTHGQLATELLNAAEMIVGDLPLLIGCGLTEFSLTPGALPGARRVVHDTSAGEMGRIAARVLTLGTVDEIEQCLLGAFGRSEVVTEVNTP